MNGSQEFEKYLGLAEQEYRQLYNIYNEIILIVNALETQTHKRMRKLSNIDKGLDDDRPIEEKTQKQTGKFTQSITEFNSKIDDQLLRFKKSHKKTLVLYLKVRTICIEEQKNMDCLMAINKKLKLMKLIIQKFLNKILRLQSRSNVFPNFSSEFDSATRKYEKNLKRTIVALRTSIAECMETEESMHSAIKNIN